jgi:hypothetical protein
LIDGDEDNDEIPDFIEFLVNGYPNQHDPNPVFSGTEFGEFILNNQASAESITFNVECSTDLKSWSIHSGSVAPSPVQTNVPAGFTRMRIVHPADKTRYFYRLRANCPRTSLASRRPGKIPRSALRMPSRQSTRRSDEPRDLISPFLGCENRGLVADGFEPGVKRAVRPIRSRNLNNHLIGRWNLVDGNFDTILEAASILINDDRRPGTGEIRTVFDG